MLKPVVIHEAMALAMVLANSFFAEYIFHFTNSGPVVQNETRHKATIPASIPSPAESKGIAESV